MSTEGEKGGNPLLFRTRHGDKTDAFWEGLRFDERACKTSKSKKFNVSHRRKNSSANCEQLFLAQTHSFVGQKDINSRCLLAPELQFEIHSKCNFFFSTKLPLSFV